MSTPRPLPRRSRRRVLSVAALAMSAIAAPLPAPAQESSAQSTAELPTITVTATRSGRDVDRTARAVTVITREQIEERTPSSPLDLLRETPGLAVSRAGGLGGQVNLRGFSSNDFRVPLLIDGDRFRGRNTLEYNLLNPDDIERIEVLRGPAAALYGTDSLSGLVNVITRRARGDLSQPFRFTGWEANVRAATADALRGLGLAAEGVGSGVDARLSVSGRRADNYDSPLGTIRNSDFAVLNTSLRLGYAPVEGHRFEIIARHNEVESGRAGGIGGAPGFPLLSLREDPIKETFVRLGYSGDASAIGLGRIEASFYVRELSTEIRTVNRTVANQVTDSTNYVSGPTVYGGKLFTTLPWRGGLLTFGSDFFHEDRPGSENYQLAIRLRPNGSVLSATETARAKSNPDATQTDLGFFVANDWDPVPWLTLQAAGRVDRFTTTTDTTPLPAPQLRPLYEQARSSSEVPLTGSIGAVVRPLSWLHLVGNVGNTFRAPSTAEAFGSSRQGAGFLVPNPALRSERGVTYEAGLRFRPAPELSANLTLFHSDYEDLIVRRPVTFLGLPSQQRQNVGSATIQGIEFDARWVRPDGFTPWFSVTALRGTDTQTDTPLPYVAPLQGAFGLKYEPPGAGGWFVEGVGLWAASKTRIDPAQERSTAGYAVFSVFAGLDLRRAAPWLPDGRLTVGVENLFDQAYRNPTTVEDPRFAQTAYNPLVERGRTGTATLRVRF